MKRVRTMHNGKLISMSEEDYKTILKRFNSTNFSFNGDGDGAWCAKYVNNTPCPLCQKHSRYDHSLGHSKCTGCTLRKFNSSTELGCINILHDIIDTTGLSIGTTRVSFDRHRRAECSTQLRKFYKFLQEWR